MRILPIVANSPAAHLLCLTTLTAIGWACVADGMTPTGCLGLIPNGGLHASLVICVASDTVINVLCCSLWDTACALPPNVTYMIVQNVSWLLLLAASASARPFGGTDARLFASISSPCSS